MKEGPELDAALVPLLESAPAYLPDFETVFSAQHEDDEPIQSEAGLWSCICNYEFGDRPKWIPNPVSWNANCAMAVIRAMNERGLFISLADQLGWDETEDGGLVTELWRIAFLDVNAHEAGAPTEKIWFPVEQGETFSEAVALAALAALTGD